ncbi:MAG: hypothetical protein R3C41_13410 [Calditrichia bacterium]|nr:hypothetical protein [Calditrichota bacterium]MCB0285632.1 hypothetical protein [Calditrichota bacterium]MCB9067182.1 hypothetical protein [Calditrichia bacterium]
MNNNPIKEIITDDKYQKLMSMGFLNERAIRDYYLRKKFESLRRHYKPGLIVERLREEFPYLTIETVRKIVYSKHNHKLESLPNVNISPKEL